MRTLVGITLALVLSCGLARAADPDENRRTEDAAEESLVRSLIAEQAAFLNQAAADLAHAQEVEAQILTALDE